MISIDAVKIVPAAQWRRTVLALRVSAVAMLIALPSVWSANWPAHQQPEVAASCKIDAISVRYQSGASASIKLREEQQ